MKKTIFKRVFSLALMLVMLVSLASIGVSATGLQELFESQDYEGFFWYGNWNYLSNDAPIVVTSSDFEKYVQPWNSVHTPSEWRDLTWELAGIKLDDLDLFVKDLTDKVEVEAYPDYNDFDNWEDFNKAHDEWFNKYGYEMLDEDGDTVRYYKDILLVYRYHKHNLQGSQMYFDDNYHWQLCTECANRVYLANHTDKDADGKCDFCGNAIRYYNVTVKNAAGGKVALSANKGAMNDKITVTVTPDAGYHLEKLNFVNANAAHSKRAVWEDTPNAEYHFFVANWDVEVEAVFVKD